MDIKQLRHLQKTDIGMFQGALYANADKLLAVVEAAEQGAGNLWQDYASRQRVREALNALWEHKWEDGGHAADCRLIVDPDIPYQARNELNHPACDCNRSRLTKPMCECVTPNDVLRTQSEYMCEGGWLSEGMKDGCCNFSTVFGGHKKTWHFSAGFSVCLRWILVHLMIDAGYQNVPMDRYLVQTESGVLLSMEEPVGSQEYWFTLKPGTGA